ncbi:C2H2-like zinc finger protein [Raphanus sativus]|uniref:Zinc finger protein ZAT4-like n=1 Tax=Raphanus sativus TaxID=3726 RepID=A0A9W3CLW4_RAPSA|nr:zinc finger protein ZAT4-like [Raphanus sativus]KAJ4872843.1 C2H2-like zinc finger protein [Raphanus sativus]
METIVEKEYVCKFCNKKFPSGKSLGGHIRIHTSLHSNSNSGKKPKKKNKKRLVDQREITALKHQQLCCRECGKGFDSLKDLWNHMDCWYCEVEKSDTETSSSSPTRKRSKKQSSSESFSFSYSACEIEEEHKNTALSLMMMSMDPRGLTLVVKSLVAQLPHNSEILETKLSSGEQQLKMIFNVAVDDQLRSSADGAILTDSYSSDSDYFMNGPKRSDSDISVDGCLRNNGDDDFEAKEGRSQYELRNSKNVTLPCNETDSCADTNMKEAISAKKNSKGHECPICFRVFKSGPALGGHKRSHFIGNHDHRIKHKVATDMGIELNLPAHEI